MGMAEVDALKSAAKTKAAGKIAKGTATANKIVMDAKKQALKEQQAGEAKVTALQAKATKKMKVEAQKTAQEEAVLKKLKAKIDRRLKKAKTLEKQAAAEHEKTKLAKAHQEKTFKVNKAYLKKEQRAAVAALQKA